MVVGAGGEQVQRDAVAVGGHGVFGALFAAVNRAAAGDLTTAGSFGDRPVYGQILQVQSDDPVIGGQGDPQHRRSVPGLGPLGQAAADGALRAARRGDALVAAAVHQGGDQVVEHDPVRDASAVASPRVGGDELGTPR